MHSICVRGRVQRANLLPPADIGRTPHALQRVLVEHTRRLNSLAAAGRYDSLIKQYAALKSKSKQICAVAVQVALEKITVALATYQSTSVQALVKEQLPFGVWSPRRCDVYVTLFQPGSCRTDRKLPRFCGRTVSALIPCMKQASRMWITRAKMTSALEKGGILLGCDAITSGTKSLTFRKT
ncbi:hypothetical protein EDC04DRAFT_1150636 [Pisolithus marmoratus]|nr:hypothetical protein EDC04DRAFT_1150636 [Pisolithus marmoratus]